MSQEFKQINEWISRVNHNLFEGYNYFYIWDTFQRLMGTDIVGQSEAEQNAKIINQFRYFFVPTIEANRKILAIELYKVFDTNKKAISLKKIINFIRDNIDKFGVEDFKVYHQDRKLLNHLVDIYVPITKVILKECENEISRIDNLIVKLKDFRHTQAHNQIMAIDSRMTIAEIEEIFTVASNIINKLSYALNHSTNQPFHAKESIKHETNSVIEHLKRFEPYRLKEIEEEYRITIKNTK